MSWQPVTLSDTPAPFAPNQIEFTLTDSDRSRIALYQAQAIAAVRKQNDRDAKQGLAAWRGQMHRVGEVA